MFVLIYFADFARYEKISFIFAKKVSAAFQSGGTNVANMLQTMQGQR